MHRDLNLTIPKEIPHSAKHSHRPSVVKISVAAVGIDAGHKHVLGFWQDATENSEVCTTLINNLVERGLDSQNVMGHLPKELQPSVRKTMRDAYASKTALAMPETSLEQSKRGAPRRLAPRFGRDWKNIS